jgi:hypothetical protein
MRKLGLEVPTPGPFKEASQFNFQAGRGGTTTQVWRDTFEALTGKFSDLVASGYSGISFTREGDSPLWRLEGTVAGNPEGDFGEGTDDPLNQILDTYELAVNQIQQSILVNENVVNTLTNGNIDFIRDTYNQIVRGEKSIDEGVTAVTAEAGTNSALAVQVLRDLHRDHDTFLAFAYVFRRTRSVPPVRADFEVLFTGVNKVWTREQIITFEVLDALEEPFTLPTGGEWLKLPPEVNAQAGQRTQVIWEYHWADEWNSAYYEAYTP